MLSMCSAFSASFLSAQAESGGYVQHLQFRSQKMIFMSHLYVLAHLLAGEAEGMKQMHTHAPATLILSFGQSTVEDESRQKEGSGTKQGGVKMPEKCRKVEKEKNNQSYSMTDFRQSSVYILKSLCHPLATTSYSLN